MRSCLFLFSFPPLGRAFAVLLAALCLAVPSRLSAAAADGQRFESIDDAVKALTEAVRNGDTNAIRIIFGPAGQELVSPDVVQAGAERTLFMNRVREKAETVRESDTKAILHLGSDGWPFPIPLVKWEGRWFFETEAGAEEILNRRIGMNEIGAIRVCRAYVEAQHEYYSQDRNGDGVVEYAQKLRSGSGLRDGLYWPANPGEPLSPLGPLIAKARVEGYRHRNNTSIMTDGESSPYHGYYFKILTRQGKHAPGGEYNYTINGHMVAGFALVAWPAEWGNSGVMTFLVNQNGKVYQRNLGAKTDDLASRIGSFNLGPEWTEAKEE